MNMEKTTTNDDAFFLLGDADDRIGLFTWHPSRSRGVLVPEGVTLRDFKRLGSASAVSLRRLAVCMHAAKTAIRDGAVTAPQEVAPDVLVALDPPMMLARRDDVVPLPLERPAVLLSWGTAQEAWVLARKAGGWIDVYDAWANPDGPSGLAVYEALYPGGEAPEGMPLERAFRRVNAPEDLPFTREELPEVLGGPLPSLPLRFIQESVVDPGATLGAYDPAPPEQPDDRWRKALPALALAAGLLLLAIFLFS